VNCKTLVVELEDYLDESLDPELRSTIELHLAKCKNCKLIVDTTKKTIQIYCNSEPAPLSEDTRHRLHHALIKKLGRVRA
jgi:predicted anti-sigma-YlaC factor YlaD